RPGQTRLAAGQRVRGGGPAPSPGAAEHRPAPRYRLLSGPSAPQRSTGSGPADAHQRADPEGSTQDCGRKEGRQGAALVASPPARADALERPGAVAVGCRDTRHFPGAGTGISSPPGPAWADPRIRAQRALPGSRRERVPETRGMIVNEPRTTRVLIGSD